MAKTAADEFNPTSISKVVKGKMVLLYAKVDGVDVHVASFFHENKADWVIEAIEGHHEVLAKKEKPKMTTASAKTVTKKAVKKKVKK